MSRSETVATMAQLKKDWADLGARAQVSETGLDVDRAALLARYRDEEGLSQKEIGEALGLSQQRVAHLLLYRRYNQSTTASSTAISEGRFRAYWQQIADPKLTRGRREPDAEYEALCFADIGKLVEKGTPPLKVRRKKQAAKPEDIKTIRHMGTAVRQIYNRRLKEELKRLKRLLHADRSTYTPALLAQSAAIIDEDIRAILKLLRIQEELPEHGAPEAATADH